MAEFTDKPWDGSASRWSDTASYCDACLVNNNTGDDRDKWTQAECHFPVKEPGSGAVNKNAVHNAAARLMQSKISPSDKKKVARALQSYYRQMKEDVPDGVKNMAQ